METTNPSAEVAQDPIAAIQGILDREGEVEQQEQEVEAPEVEAEPAEDVEAQEGDSADDGYEEVEYDGKSYQLPKELKEAVLRHADYTRKTQEVAEQRRLAEALHETVKAREMAIAEEQQFHQVALQDMAEITAVNRTLEQYKGVDWQSLSDNDPVQAQKLWFAYQQEQQKSAQLQQALQGKYQQFAAHRQKVMQEAAKKGMEALKKDIPNWSAETARELREVGKSSYGFTDAELQQVYDPRFVKLLADAAAYRKLQASKPAVNKRVADVPKTVKPGAQQSNSARKAEAYKASHDRLKKTGRVEDAAAVIAKLM